MRNTMRNAMKDDRFNLDAQVRKLTNSKGEKIFTILGDHDTVTLKDDSAILIRTYSELEYDEDEPTVPCLPMLSAYMQTQMEALKTYIGTVHLLTPTSTLVQLEDNDWIRIQLTDQTLYIIRFFASQH